jgi:hypothetical protein
VLTGRATKQDINIILSLSTRGGSEAWFAAQTPFEK